MEYPRTTYVEKLSKRYQNGLIKVITGVRRAGKSYLLNELFYRFLLNQGIPTAQIIRFAFDSDEDIDLLDSYYPEETTRIKQKNGTIIVNAKKFRAFIKDKTDGNASFFLLLDEVQLLENFVGTLNGLQRHKNFDLYVTGSNSRFLSSDIASEFKGRSSIIHVMPLMFSEYMQNLEEPPQDAWKEYIETGGIPIVATMRDKEEKITYLKGLCEETYLKDIIQHNGIRKTVELADTFDIIASMIGTPVNDLKITNTFESVLHKKITDDTIANFIGYFEDAFVISKAKKYNIKGRKYIGSPYKLFFEDIGVRNARLNFRQIEESHIMENIIYNELRYRGFTVDVGAVDKYEVDFIASFGSQKYYVQSALSVADPDKLAQEKRALKKTNDSFKKIIVTKNGLNPARDEDGILIIDLFDFLLNTDSLEW